MIFLQIIFNLRLQWVGNAICILFSKKGEVSVQSSSGCSYRISKGVLCRSQWDTPRWRQVQRDGSASERLSRNHAAVSRAGWKTTWRNNSGQSRWSKPSAPRLGSVIVPRVRWWICSPLHWRRQWQTVTSFPKQHAQVGRCCLDSKIWSDHFHINVRTLCVTDLIWETNPIRLLSETVLTWLCYNALPLASIHMLKFKTNIILV